MTPEIYKLYADNKPLPIGTRIKSKWGLILELTANQLQFANKCPNHMSEHVPFWVLGWANLHDDLLASNQAEHKETLETEEYLFEGPR